MNIKDYLIRIRCIHAVRPDPATLNALHLAHMLTVPFENLDIRLKLPIELEEQALWRKIVVQKRGGFCYELNGLFAWLLTQIGYDVVYLNGRVFNKSGKLGIEFDHLVLLVRIPELPGRWLVDVGYGDSFTQPLDFEERGEQIQGLRAYRLEQIPYGVVLWQRNYGGNWEREYFFDLQPRKFPDDYEAGCLYHQTSPLSSFTQGDTISMATPNGRITLTDDRFIVTEDGRRSERGVNSREEFDALLKAHFGVVLDKEKP
jgi:N-hydroxyarylamine O-acetyltransferase